MRWLFVQVRKTKLKPNVSSGECVFSLDISAPICKRGACLPCSVSAECWARNKSEPVCSSYGKCVPCITASECKAISLDFKSCVKGSCDTSMLGCTT